MALPATLFPGASCDDVSRYEDDGVVYLLITEIKAQGNISLRAIVSVHTLLKVKSDGPKRMRLYTL